MKFSSRHYIIFSIMVTEVLGFSLILPFLPYYAQKLGASPFVVGLIPAVFSMFQFFSAPIMGKLSDHYGRRPMLMISQLSTFISFIILGFSNSLWMIFFSRIVDGLLGSNFTIAQAYLSDISSREDRSKAFGLSGMAFGVGFLVGPAIGGTLAKNIGYSLPSFIAAGISLLTILITYFALPETIKKGEDIHLDLKIFHFDQILKYFREKKTSNKLWTYFFYSLAHMLYVSTFALFAQRQLGFSELETGLALTYVGLISIVFRGYLLGKLIDAFKEKPLRSAGALAMIMGLGLAAFIRDGRLFFIVITLFSSGTGLVRPLLVGEISRRASDKDQGAVMGVASSLVSISQIVSPLVGGAIIDLSIGFPGLMTLTAAGIMMISLALMQKKRIAKFTSILVPNN